jgi:hypothetical protein
VSAAATRLTSVADDVRHRVGVRQQRDERVAHDPIGGLGTGGEEQPQEPVDLLVGELVAVDLGVHEVADEVVTRAVTPVLDDRLEVLAHRP